MGKIFNPKRPGSIVGVMTDVSEYLRVLYAQIGNGREDGACPSCGGTGVTFGDIDPHRMIAPELSLKNGAVLLWAGTICGPVFAIKELAKKIGIDYDRPLVEQDKRFIDILLYGYDQEPVEYMYKNKLFTRFYRGCVNDLRFMRDAGTRSKGNLKAIEFFSARSDCPECSGSNRSSELAAISIMPIPELLSFTQNLPHTLTEHEAAISGPCLSEIETRLKYLNKIGLRALCC